MYILVDDPTCYGGIQQFSRDLAAVLGKYIRVVLLAYSGTLSELKPCGAEVIRLNHAERRPWWTRWLLGGAEVYLHPGWRRNLALLADSLQIRRRLAETMKDGGILLINAFHAAHLFVPRCVMKRNTVCFVQHSSPAQIYKWRYDFGGFFRRTKLRMFNEYVDAMVMLSPFERPEFAKYLDLSGKLVKVIRHRTELPEIVKAPPTRTVMFIGRLSKEKRVDRLLEVAKAAPDFEFNIYGDGPDEALLKKAAEGLANVCFHGYLNDISMAMAKNSIAMIVSEAEGYPIAGIECVAHGKPLLVLNSFPAARDLVADGENGILLNEFSASAFAEALRAIYADYGHFRENALAARNKYDSAVFEHEWKSLIESLAAEEQQ